MSGATVNHQGAQDAEAAKMTGQQQAVRYISRRKESFDHFIRDQVDQAGFGVECEYHGIETAGRASEVRLGLRRGGKRLGVAVKAFTADCGGCRNGGPKCRFHIRFTTYPIEDARAYMRRKAEALQWGTADR